MKKNMGITDRVIRILLVVLVAVLYFTKVIHGALAIVLGIIALVFLLTSIFGVCPLYIPFGIKTICKGKTEEKPQETTQAQQ
jgi:hypothetical protein